METVYSVALLIEQGHYMLKIDLKDAYYSVKTLEKNTKYLKFFAASKLLKFVLRLEGIIISIYIIISLYHYIIIFECRVTLSKDAVLDLEWWRDNIIFASKSLQYPRISKVIYTDASNVGWGVSWSHESPGFWRKNSGI